MYFLWAHHDPNKIAPCGMIKVFELNCIELQLNFLLQFSVYFILLCELSVW